MGAADARPLLALGHCNRRGPHRGGSANRRLRRGADHDSQHADTSSPAAPPRRDAREASGRAGGCRHVRDDLVSADQHGDAGGLRSACRRTRTSARGEPDEQQDADPADQPAGQPAGDPGVEPSRLRREGAEAIRDRARVPSKGRGQGERTAGREGGRGGRGDWPQAWAYLAGRVRRDGLLRRQGSRGGVIGPVGTQWGLHAGGGPAFHAGGQEGACVLQRQGRGAGRRSRP